MIRSILTAIVAGAIVVSSASIAQAQSAPVSPAATAAAIARGVPLHTLAAQGNPNVRVQRVNLLPGDCARLLAGVPAAEVVQARAQHCSMFHYSFHANHLPVPTASNRATGVSEISGAVTNGSICCGFWYYTNDDELTDIANGTVWSANQWEDGVANGRNVYAWHNQCTPVGLGVAIDDCFTNFNGADVHGVLRPAVRHGHLHRSHNRLGYLLLPSWPAPLDR